MRPHEYHVLAALEGKHWWYRALRRRLLAKLEQEARRKNRPLRVFDAGCGTGAWLGVLSLHKDIQAAEGCDLHPLAVGYAQARGLKVERRSVNALGGLPADWDVVCSIDVLYHREVDPQRALEGMAALLAPGGMLLLNVAAMPCLSRPHDDNVMGARRYLPTGLRKSVEAAGLHTETLCYWNSWLTPFLWVAIRLGERPRTGEASALQQPPGWLNESLNGVLEMEGRLAPMLPLPWGSSLLLTARKSP
ncbi:MAG: class I SAM-dependent methyltransferase [Cyanobacteriota bacterium]|nr:class I SAM-dependent methyltransferase [Cyanobacteriota bacterium]